MNLWQQIDGTNRLTNEKTPLVMAATGRRTLPAFIKTISSPRPPLAAGGRADKRTDQQPVLVRMTPFVLRPHLKVVLAPLQLFLGHGAGALRSRPLRVSLSSKSQ